MRYKLSTLQNGRWIILDTTKGVNGSGQVVHYPISPTLKVMSFKTKQQAEEACNKLNKIEKNK